MHVGPMDVRPDATWLSALDVTVSLNNLRRTQNIYKLEIAENQAELSVWKHVQ